MRAWRLMLAAGLLTLAVVGGWRAAAGRPPTLDERVSEVAAGLRCPACQGQSVADSESDLARQMRQVTRDQLAQGRTPGQVRVWFAERYGDSVLLDPPARGPGLVALAVPVLALALGVGLLARFLGGPGRLVPVACAGAVVVLGGVALTVTSAAQGDVRAGGDPPPAPPVGASPGPSPTLPLPPQAVAPTPSASGGASVRQALATLQGGDAAAAEQMAQTLLAEPRLPAATRADALLVLGLAQRSLGDPAAEVTLRTFLSQAPSHPAAAKVRALLTSPSR